MTKLKELAQYWVEAEKCKTIFPNNYRFSATLAKELGKDIIDMYCRLEILEKAIDKLKNK